MSSHRLLHRPSSAWSASPGARSRDTSKEERSLDGSPLRVPPMSTSRRSLLSSSPRRGASSADVTTPLALGSDATSSTGRLARLARTVEAAVKECTVARTESARASAGYGELEMAYPTASSPGAAKASLSKGSQRRRRGRRRIRTARSRTASSSRVRERPLA